MLVYLHDADIDIHSSGRVVSKSPLNGTITVAIQDKGRGRTHTLGRAVADQIFIELLSDPTIFRYNEKYIQVELY